MRFSPRSCPTWGLQICREITIAILKVKLRASLLSARLPSSPLKFILQFPTILPPTTTKMLPFSLFTLHTLFSILRLTSAQTCYFPSGAPLPSTDWFYSSMAPCNLPGLETICCATNRTNPSGADMALGNTRDECLPNGLCQNRKLRNGSDWTTCVVPSPTITSAYPVSVSSSSPSTFIPALNLPRLHFHRSSFIKNRRQIPTDSPIQLPRKLLHLAKLHISFVPVYLRPNARFRWGYARHAVYRESR